MSPTVSLVIPVRNESKGIRACLDSWFSQSIPVEEIVVIDSGSTDATLDIVKSYDKVHLVEIPGAEFNHGTTRNRAMQHVTGEFTLMTVGDGRAYDSTVLAGLLAGFDNDRVAGVCGHQAVPHDPDKNPVEWFRPQSESRKRTYSFSSPAEFDGLTPEKKKQAASWDDVIAMYRTSVLRDQIPYREVTYGEDPMWAVDALKAGHTLVYDPSARVCHYHLEDNEVTYRRAITMLCLRKCLFGSVPDVPKTSLRSTLSMIRVLLRTPGLTLREKWKWYQFNQANHRALVDAVTDFLAAEREGDENLRQLHDQCAGKPFKVLSVASRIAGPMPMSGVSPRHVKHASGKP